MRKVKNTIPVYDICAISGHNHAHEEIMAEPFSDYLRTHPHLFAPHRHSFYHMVLFTQGEGSHTIDFEQFDVAPGQVYFMIPGQVHSWNFKGDIEGYIINFSEDLFRPFLANANYLEQFSFFRGVAKDSVIALKGDTYPHAVNLFEKILAELKRNDSFSQDSIRLCLIELFVAIYRGMATNTPRQAPQPNQLLLYNFRKLLDSYYAEKRLPKDYAAMLYITPNHLNALCNDLLGKPAGEVIRDRILLEAKRLLINADLNISEIADRLSFTDNAHFTRFFKKYTGLTPESFRKATVNN